MRARSSHRRRAHDVRVRGSCSRTGDARQALGACDAPAGWRRRGEGAMSVLGAGGLAILIDPARTSPGAAYSLAARAAEEGAALLLVGNSFGDDVDTAEVARALKAGGGSG